MAALVKHGVLVASTPLSAALTGDFRRVEVMNRSGVAEIFFRVDGVAPTVGGDDCYVVAAVAGAVASAPAFQGGDVGDSVQLISSGAPTFSVTGRLN